jgi:hypothetical protein
MIFSFVTPAKAGVHVAPWMPAFAGMTVRCERDPWPGA